MKKLEIFKKSMAVMLSLVMMAVPVLQVRADDDPAPATDKGTITIKNPKVGHTYSAYRIFAATISGDKNENIAYTATEAQKTLLEKPVTVGETEITSPFVFELNTSDGDQKYNVSIATGRNQDVITYLESFYTADTTVNDDGTTKTTYQVNAEFAKACPRKFGPEEFHPNENYKNPNELEMKGLPFGYYFITSDLGATVTIDTANPNAEIIDKNEHSPHWEGSGKTIIQADGKKVTSNSVNYGDTVKFQIALNTSNTVGDKYIDAYYIEDTLAPGFTLDTTLDHFKVYVGSGENPTAKRLELGKDYYFVDGDNKEMTGANGTVLSEKTTSNETVFRIAVKWIQKTSENKFDKFLYLNPSRITVEYQATVNENAVLGYEGNLNTAKYKYTLVDEPETNYGNETSTLTYTYSVVINKTDSQGKKLNGAEFTLSETDGGTPIEFIKNDNGEYEYSTDVKASPTIKVDNGQIILKGLKGGVGQDDGKTYFLTETKAPDGYVTLTSSIPVVLNKENSVSKKTVNTFLKQADGKYEMIKQELYSDKEGTTASTVSWFAGGKVIKTTVTNSIGATTTYPEPDVNSDMAEEIATEYEQKIANKSEDLKTDTAVSDVFTVFVNVINYTSSELPSTGGIGTRVFYIGGGIAAAAGAALILMKKHREDEEE